MDELRLNYDAVEPVRKVDGFFYAQIPGVRRATSCTLFLPHNRSIARIS